MLANVCCVFACVSVCLACSCLFAGLFVCVRLIVGVRMAFFVNWCVLPVLTRVLSTSFVF